MARQSWFANKARRAFWSVHIEAWLQSGLTQRAYCMQHRLSANSFRRWRDAIDEDARMRGERVKRRIIRWAPRGRIVRSKALLAFWSMRLEALQWSGLSLGAYARVHHLSPTCLKYWRRRLEVDPPDTDWREMLHPSARPRLPIGVELSTAATAPVENILTTAPEAPPRRNGRSNRRSFTDEEKLAIVVETERLGVSVAAVARRHDIVTSMIFRWRAQFGFSAGDRAKLATVRLAERRGRGRPKASETLMLNDLLPPPEGAIVVKLADGRRVFAPAGGDPAAVRRRAGEDAMMVVPAGVKVHLALGRTDMRKGMDGLATMVVQQTLKKDPLSGHLFAFRGRKANIIKILFWDGNGLCLFSNYLASYCTSSDAMERF